MLLIGNFILGTYDNINYSGILSNCGTSLNHGALLVAVTNDGVWKLKNTWGSSWGEKGFIRLAAGNTCGICSYAI